MSEPPWALIISDDRREWATVSATLLDAGYQVLVASGRQEALDLAAIYGPALILLERSLGGGLLVSIQPEPPSPPGQVVIFGADPTRGIVVQPLRSDGSLGRLQSLGALLRTLTHRAGRAPR